MSLSSDDTPTGPIAGARGQQAPPGPTGPVGDSTQDPTRRRNIIRDLTGGALVVIALFFPWNLYFGFRIPDSSRLLFALLLLVTLLSLIAVAVPYAGPWRLSGARFNPVLAGRLRLGLNVPYLLLVLAFVVYDVFQTIRFGGTVHVPGGVGPGGWLGIAGSLLSAQPVITGPTADDDKYRKWLLAARIIGYASMFGAALSTGFNLCWRVRYALHGSDGSIAFGKQNISVIVTAVVYGVVALAAVLVASWWILRAAKAASRFTILALGASTLVAGIIVWILPVGREIDAFHAIAQNTSTAGVGYEGYLAWAAAAAMFAPLTLFSSSKTPSFDKDVWWAALRNGLLLIVVWCLGSVLMRITDLVVAVILNFPFSRYDTMTLAAFDLATAVLALWLRVNAANQALPARLITSLCGFLSALTVSRVIVGVVLAPRFQQSPGTSPNPVYGNDLAQQITSIFDVVLCGLALCIVAAAIVSGRLRRPPQPPRHPRRRRRPAAPRPGPGRRPGQARAGVPVPSEAKTTQFRTADAGGGDDAPTTVLSGPARSPRIFRSADSTQQLRPKIYRPPDNPS